MHALTPPRSPFLYLQFLARCHPYILLHYYTCRRKSSIRVMQFVENHSRDLNQFSSSYYVCFFYQMCVSIQILQQLLLCHTCCAICPSTACYTDTYIVTIVLGDLCDNTGLVGVSAKWSYVTASPSHHDKTIPVLSPLLFMHVSHPNIPLFKILI